MKIRIAKKSLTMGGVLVVTLVISVIIGIALVSYLIMVQTRSHSVARSQNWNMSLTVTEAGVEDALQLLNKYVGTANIGAWADPGNYGADGWSSAGANTIHTRRYLDTSMTTYYDVYITNTGGSPIIRSSGYVPLPSGFTASVSSSSTPTQLGRGVLVQTKLDALFNVAMAALGSIDLKGNNIATDSFDSTATNYPGYWTNSIRRANGDVATDNQIINSVLNVGNANVAGHVMTGPSGSVQIGANGSVGDLNWVDNNTQGIEPGYLKNDMNVIFKDVVLPNVSWALAGGLPITVTSTPGGFTPSGTGGFGGIGTVTVQGVVGMTNKTYAHVFTHSGNYTITDNGSIYVAPGISVTLQVTKGDYSPDSMYVAGMGSSAGKIVAYLTGTKCTLDTDDTSQSKVANVISFFGLPSLKDLSYGGNGDFTGVIYCPSADFQLNGGGSGIIDFIGSSITKTVQMNGHYHFHYDESLRVSGPNNGYIASSWQEVPAF